MVSAWRQSGNVDFYESWKRLLTSILHLFYMLYVMKLKSSTGKLNMYLFVCKKDSKSLELMECMPDIYRKCMTETLLHWATVLKRAAERKIQESNLTFILDINWTGEYELLLMSIPLARYERFNETTGDIVKRHGIRSKHESLRTTEQEFKICKRQSVSLRDKLT